MLLARQQTSENEQTKAYVRTTVIGMGGASRNHRYKKFSRATVFVASVTRPSKLYCFNRGVWPGEEANPGYVVLIIYGPTKSLSVVHAYCNLIGLPVSLAS